MAAEPLALEEISDVSRLEELRPEWDALFGRCPSATPFQSPEWLLPWWRHFGNNGLFVIALRRSGLLAGLAPLFIFKRPGDRLKQLSFIGSGVSDCLDFLIEPALQPEGTRMILHCLYERGYQWDLCDFQELRERSPLLDTAGKHGLSVSLSKTGNCPVLVLPRSVKEFRAGLSARLRKKLRNGMNRFRKAGGIETRNASGEDLTEFLEDLFWLHQAEWREKKEKGMFADPEIREFHREVAPGFLEKNRLRLRVLILEDRVIAALYSFASGGRLYCYLSGFDPGFAHYSPGKFVLWSAIESAIEEGLHEVDFLRGREKYKYLWGPEDRTNFRLRIRKSGRDESGSRIS